MKQRSEIIWDLENRTFTQFWCNVNMHFYLQVNTQVLAKSDVLYLVNKSIPLTCLYPGDSRVSSPVKLPSRARTTCE